MKTSILFLIMSLGFNANSWAQEYDPVTGTNNIGVGSDETTNVTPVVTTPAVTTPAATTTAGAPKKKDYEVGAYYSDEAGGNGPNKNAGGGSDGCRNGTYGGASCETTDNINLGVQLSNQVYQAVGQAAVSNKHTDVVNTLNSKGMNVKGSDYLEGQAKDADAAQKANRNAGLMQTVNAGLQGWRASAHRKSRKEIYSNANTDFQKVDAERMAECSAKTTNTEKMLCDKEYREKMAAIEKEYKHEDRAQKNKALESTIMAGQTAALAAKSMTEAAAAKRAAEEWRKRAAMGDGATGGGQFQMNQQITSVPDPGALTNTPTVEENAVVSNDPNGAGLDGGIKDFNPNIGNNSAAGPAPGAFQDAAAGKAGGGQGTGLGGSGGTSASKGDGGDGKSEGGPAKGQTGGQYASGDGGSPKFSRGGGMGAGVGVDSSFADMLKKMLPGGDEEKKDGHASLDIDQDRGPASDQAAVIGRNKNIFFEISKRYQKKNSEGAVIFQ